MARKTDPIQKIVLKDGTVRWRFTIDVGRRSDGGRDQRRYTYPTQKEAKAERAKIIASKSTGTFVVPVKVTVAVLVAEWLESKRSLKASTRSTYAGALRHVTSRLGDVEVQKLTKADVVGLVRHMRTEGRLVGNAKRKGVSGRTVNVALTILRAILDDAVKQGRLARNVAALVDNERHVPKQTHTWTADEAQAYLVSVASDRLQAAWILSLYGLRRGEILGLRWSDVDLVARTLTVRWTRGESRGVVHEYEPKSQRSTRTLPLDELAVTALTTLQLKQRDEEDDAGAAYDATCPLCSDVHVIADELGRPYRPEWLSDRFEALVRVAKLPAIRLHDARHTAGTLMHLNGVPTAVISAWLGHSSSAFTMKQYVHSQDPAVVLAGVTLAGLIHAAADTNPDVTRQ
jgi:integrase